MMRGIMIGLALLAAGCATGGPLGLRWSLSDDGKQGNVETTGVVTADAPAVSSSEAE